jgi:signal transducing adaptor molecule
MPEPTVADLAREAEAEASIFSQAANIDRLLNMLRNFDITKDNLADDEEIQVRLMIAIWCMADLSTGTLQI